ncbi:hypothetical protein M413DRAFT_447238 [Hebeloma cylindrosporum]|uniref:Protein kinase domain-containing protein n=1 Tax=Hebeloma cylindrosporum TaxID=76867 RepID=A0A0C3C4V5_HEBCY|nr:hypothetical protein M413DRAFT_447238 [Hebeloma cylindrosporum h7]
MSAMIPHLPFEMHTPDEKVWLSLQPHLLSRGYRLRPRYEPGWIPSWTRIPGVYPTECEDSLRRVGKLIDAIRISDGSKVVIKQVDTSTSELPLAMKLSSAELRSDPRNHAVPALDVILIPGNDDMALLVMPFLMDFNDLPFRHVGEVVEMVEQFLECLEFLHEHNITHMDFCWFNLMMDASRMVPRGWHFCNPWKHDGSTRGGFGWLDRWTVRPVKYYLIDFELTVPEMSETVSADSFKVDVYQLGNVIKKLTKKYTGLSVLKSLAKKMTNPDPLKRLTAHEAVKTFRCRKSKWTARSMERRVWRRTTPFIDRFMVKYRNFNAII